MAQSSSIAQVSEVIEKHSRFLLVSHYNPDPDAYGACCGLAVALRAMGKEVAIVNQNGASSRYAFVPGMELVHALVPEGDWEALVYLDCADSKRVGDKLAPLLPKVPCVVNIDHHISNDRFGDVVLLDPDASSTSELIYRLLDAIPGALSKDAAIGLLAGIYGDTGSFRYSCTKPETFLAAHKLTLLGASPFDIACNLFGSVDLSAMKLQTAALLNVQLYHEGKVAEVIVTREMLDAYGAGVDDGEMLAERARDIAGVVIAFSIREDTDVWRVSLRSKDHRYNMSELAARFGGGGHRAAAAFRSRQPLEEIRSSLREAIGKVLEETEEV